MDPQVQMDLFIWMQLGSHLVILQPVCEWIDFRFRRQTHVTPKSYLSFLDGYRDIYKRQIAGIGDMASRMATGLVKLDEASEAVDTLSKELVIKEKDLVIANAKADKVCHSFNHPSLRLAYVFYDRLILVTSIMLARWRNLRTWPLQVLIEVSEMTKGAEKVKRAVQKVKDKAQKLVDEIAVDKAFAMGMLEAARPALEEAEAALQVISCFLT